MDHRDVTGLLVKWGQGEEGVIDQILPAVYDELRRIAGRFIHRERIDHTLQPTALINEAYLRLVDQRQVTVNNRAHFFGIAARVMRQILVEHARARHAAKRGGTAIHVQLDEGLHGIDQSAAELVTLDEALERLAKMDAQQSRIVELRYFGGLTIEETAEALKVSPATVKRSWTVARAWLKREVSKSNLTQ